MKKTTRRRFLLLATGATGACALSCASLAAIGTRGPAIELPSTSCGEGEAVSIKVLVAYATRCGSTAEVAEAIGEVLCEAGLAVDICPAKQVRDVSSYQAVVLGSAIRMGKPLSEATEFVRHHSHALAALPVAYFHLGTSMNRDTPENREKASAALAPLREVVAPVSEGLFGGKVDPARLELGWRLALSFVKEGDMAPGDHRNWEAIRSWATELTPLLVGA